VLAREQRNEAVPAARRQQRKKHNWACDESISRLIKIAAAKLSGSVEHSSKTATRVACRNESNLQFDKLIQPILKPT